MKNEKAQKINPFLEPIDHILERFGLCSKRAFKNFIKKHKVEIISNKSQIAQIVSERSTSFDSDKDILLIDNKKINIPPHLYIFFNKAKGVVCSRVSDRHQTIFSQFSASIQNKPLFKHLHIAGRLDEQSTGLVFLSTNGSFTNHLISPQNHLPKKYKVILQNECTALLQEEYKKQFLTGFKVSAQKKAGAFICKPAKIEFISKNICEVTLTEGKFHQVRRMFEELGNVVIDLERINIGNFYLPCNMAQNAYILLSRKEIENIFYRL